MADENAERRMTWPLTALGWYGYAAPCVAVFIHREINGWPRAWDLLAVGLSVALLATFVAWLQPERTAARRRKRS